MKEVMLHTSFENKDRLLEIIREMKALMEASISGEGHRLAYGRLIYHRSMQSTLKKKARGLTFYHFVCDIEKNWKDVQDETVACLKRSVYHCVANKTRLVVGVTVDEESVETVISAIDETLSDIPAKEVKTLKRDFKISEEKEALIYPSNVNYVATGYNFKALGL